MRDSIIFYRSFYEAINELPEKMQAKVYSAIFEYSLNFNEVVLEGLPKTIFTLIKPQLEANKKKFENGKKGGKPKANPNQNETKTEANVECRMSNVNVECINENDNEEKEKKDKSATPKFSFFNSLVELGISKELANDWIAVRRTKKLTNTQTAFKNLEIEFKKSGKPPAEIITKCVSESWGGFKANWDWGTNSNNLQNGKSNSGFANPKKQSYVFSVDEVLKTVTGNSK